MKRKLLVVVFSISLFACNQHQTQEPTKPLAQQTSTTPDGKHIERYPNGVIKFEGEYKNGERNGVWKSYYENGTPWSETTYQLGKKNGATKTFYQNGKLRYEGFFTDDKESGTWIFYDENEKQVNKQQY
jgi:antitoxin component YwqK of YwqJK toxin-antitoxin module